MAFFCANYLVLCKRICIILAKNRGSFLPAMTILDRYILRKFLLTFVFVVIIFLSIVVVIDIIEKIEFYNRMTMPGKLWLIINDYYLNFIPFITNAVSPLLVFITTVFVTSQMASRTEIVAILSSGVSFPRFLVPYWIGSSFLAIITFYLIGWVIPDANKVRVDFENTYTNSRYHFDQRNVHIKVAPKTYAYMESYDNQSNIGYKFTLELIEDNELKEKLTAPRIVWDTSVQKWRIDEFSLRKIKGLKEEISRGGRIDTTLKLSPQDFQSKNMFEQKLTLPELDEHIRLLRERGAEGIQLFLIEKYSRFTYPFAIIILTMIGVIVSARKSRRGIGAQIALGFALAFVYILFFFMSKAIALGGTVPPVLAVWLPNVVFTSVGFILYKAIPK